MMLKTSDEDFEAWLFEMDNALERFLSLLPTQIRPALDFSPGSSERLMVTDNCYDAHALEDACYRKDSDEVCNVRCWLFLGC